MLICFPTGKRTAAVRKMRLRGEWLAAVLIAIWALVGAIPLDACLLGACQDGCSMQSAAAVMPGCDGADAAHLSGRSSSSRSAEVESAGCTCGKIEVSSSATFQPAQDTVARPHASACAIRPSAPSASLSSPGFSHEESTQRAPVSLAKEATGTRAPPSA